MKNSELQLEKDFIKHLEELGYEYANNITDEAAMKINFKKKLEQLNKYDLTDEQFSTILIYLESGSIFDKAVKLRDGFDLKQEDNTIKTIYFLNQKDWCKNIFQVINQFKLSDLGINNRYDVSILVNGLPMVHIELKKSTVSIREAFGQVDRYKRETMDRSFFYQFVQIFVMSNGNSTRYVANNKEINSLFAFKFVDFYNNPVNDLVNFTQHFMERCRLGKFLSKYIILSNDNNHETIMLMRPYQVNAVEGILNKLDNQANGYVWHTTGSGKTLTSFKTCELISERQDIDKVIFVVDRIDLDRQTVSEYQKFKKQHDDGVQTIGSVRELHKVLADPSVKIIVTTIQKLDIICKGESIKSNLKVVLVFDECHRGQLGDTHQRISKFFNDPCKYGFTGTPIFVENRNTNDGDLQTTTDVFGDRLHTYTIADAIVDRNVLGFKMEYKDVVKSAKGALSQEEVEGNYDRREVFNSAGYVNAIAHDIIDTYNGYTINREYNAMFACDGIQSAIRYYRYFKGEPMSQKVGGVEKTYTVKPHNLKIACVFSVSENEILENDKISSKDAMMEIINDYNEMFKEDENAPSFDYSTMREYRADVERRVKNRQIDLLIVSDMFLTGFDAKRLNTLYLDKEQKYHTLIQTLSRTNRVHSHKKNFGNINCYRTIKDNVEDAVRLFSNENALEKVIPPAYDEQLAMLVEAIDQLQSVYPDIESTQNLKGDIQRRDFVEKMRNVNRLLNATKQYRDFSYDDIPIDKLSLQEFEAKYIEIYQEMSDEKGKDNKVSILSELDFEINLIERVVMNYDYIKHYLLKDLENLTPDTELYATGIRQIIEKVEKDPQLRTKLELIKDFLDKYTGEKSILNDFDDYTENLNLIRLNNFCEAQNINAEGFLVVRDQFFNGRTLTQLRDSLEELITPDVSFNFIQRRAMHDEKLEAMKLFLLDYREEILGN